MKKIGFIGAYDKTDFILYIAKILVEMGRKVLLVDGTLTQKAKYIIPVIKPSKSYVTEFEGIDIAVGFENFDNIKQYLALPQMIDLNYDIALIDLDTIDAVEKYQLETFEQNYFVTSFDMYSIKRGLESISGLQVPIHATKILFSKEALKEEDDYLNFLSFYYAIQWSEKKIYFPYDMGDSTAIIEGQRTSKIKFKYLSDTYKDGLEAVVFEIEPTTNKAEVKKILRNI